MRRRGARLGFLVEFRRFYVTVPRQDMGDVHAGKLRYRHVRTTVTFHSKSFQFLSYVSARRTPRQSVINHHLIRLDYHHLQHGLSKHRDIYTINATGHFPPP